MVDKPGDELGREFTYRLDFDGTRALFILTPAAWPIERDAGWMHSYEESRIP